MLVGVRLVLSIWSFLYEVFFGKKTFTETMRSNPGKLFLLACCMLSLGINIRVLPKVLNLNERNVVLERSYKELQEQAKDGNPSFEELSKLRAEVLRLKSEAAGKAPPTPVPKKNVVEEDSDWVLSQFEIIKQRESKDIHRQK